MNKWHVLPIVWSCLLIPGPWAHEAHSASPDGRRVVRLEVEEEDWFELRGPGEHTLTIASNDIEVVYFPIHVDKFGRQGFQVTAWGEKMSESELHERWHEAIAERRRPEEQFTAEDWGAVEDSFEIAF